MEIDRLTAAVVQAARLAMAEAHEDHPDGWLIHPEDGRRLADALNALDAALTQPQPDR